VKIKCGTKGRKKDTGTRAALGETPKDGKGVIRQAQKVESVDPPKLPASISLGWGKLGEVWGSQNSNKCFLAPCIIKKRSWTSALLMGHAARKKAKANPLTLRNKKSAKLQRQEDLFKKNGFGIRHISE